MGEISIWTWLQASFVLLVVAIMGGAIGWGLAGEHTYAILKGARVTKQKLETLDRIHAILDVEGEEWDSETIELVAEVIREAGYVIHDPNDPSIAD